MPTIPPDAIINGTYNSTDAQLNFDSMLWCLRGAASGWITGRLTTFADGGQHHYGFSSYSATMVKVVDDWISRGAGAAFDQVSVQEDDLTPVNNCQLFLSAASDDNGVWTGSVTIVYPNEARSLSVFGQFAGSIQVFRQVSCTASPANQ